MEPKKKKSVRLWAVVFWLLVWQGASMALAALYPHGALLLASPLSALARLGELAVTAAFWRTALTSAARILGGFLLAVAGLFFTGLFTFLIFKGKFGRRTVAEAHLLKAQRAVEELTPKVEAAKKAQEAAAQTQ